MCGDGSIFILVCITICFIMFACCAGPIQPPHPIGEYKVISITSYSYDHNNGMTTGYVIHCLIADNNGNLFEEEWELKHYDAPNIKIGENNKYIVSGNENDGYKETLYLTQETFDNLKFDYKVKDRWF